MQSLAPSFRLSALFSSLALSAFALPVHADTITLEPEADTTIIQNSDYANGGSTGIFAGQTNMAGARRGLLRFNVAGELPAGAIVTRATLQMTVAQTTSDAANFALHRLTGAWNEGVAAGSGQGAPASSGDTTWLYRVYSDAPGQSISWTNPGGDFVTTASATTLVAFSGTYTWASTAATVADVQGWLDNSTTNNGWLLKATSEIVVPTAKRFLSRESAPSNTRPQLTIEYTAAGPTCNDIDFNNDSSFFDPQDIDAFLSVYSEGPCIPDTQTCDSIDFNNDSSVFDPCDIDSFLLVFSEGPCTLCGV